MRTDFARRARGSLFGAAIGDAMGAPCEGAAAADIRARYGKLEGFVSDAAVGTDDTDFTLFNASILLAHGVNVTPEVVEQEWRDKLLSGKWFYRPGGFSDVTSTRNLVAGMRSPASGSFGHQMWSDGVAMAISSAGIVSAGNPQQAARLAQVLGSVSNGRDGIYTAQAVAAAISVAMVGASPEAMMEAALAAPPADSWTRRALEKAQQVAATVDDPDEGFERIASALTVEWWPWADLSPEAVGLAFAAFLATRGNFALAVPYGIGFGRDADTIGAIVGSLAGAYAGEDAIPADWKARVHTSTGACIGYVKGQSITDIGDRLAAIAESAQDANGKAVQA
jgi:ADP-ribosylglycohydrolase